MTDVEIIKSLAERVDWTEQGLSLFDKGYSLEAVHYLKR